MNWIIIRSSLFVGLVLLVCIFPERLIVPGYYLLIVLLAVFSPVLVFYEDVGLLVLGIDCSI